MNVYPGDSFRIIGVGKRFIKKIIHVDFEKEIIDI